MNDELKMTTIFIAAQSFSDESAKKLGRSQIVIGNDNGTETMMRDNVFDTGFYLIDAQITAQWVEIRRIELDDTLFHSLSSLRVYQTPNLLQYGATVYR